MADLDEIGVGASTLDPFASGLKGSTKIHVRTQQRNGRKCFTTIQGLDKDLDCPRIMKAMRKRFNTNGSIINSEKTDRLDVIQLQGDQRMRTKDWLIEHGIITQQEVDRIVIHGAY